MQLIFEELPAFRSGIFDALVRSAREIDVEGALKYAG